MTWPTAAVGTINTDQTTDSPATARADILQAMQNVNSMMTHIGSAEVAVASAATTDIGAQASNRLSLTGSATITSFGTVYTSGPIFVRIAAGAAPVFTQNTTILITPNGATFTGVAGDCFVAYPKTTAGTADGWVISNYQSAGGLTYGQCQLSLVSGSLKLLPKNGNLLSVNKQPCTVPDAGVTLAATGLTATTLYYIYAISTAGVITSLEASTTGHSTDTTAGNKGVEIKTGDATRSLVGMAYVKTAATFADTSTQRFVRSWYNEAGTAGALILASNTAFGSSPFNEVSSGTRAELIVWAGEKIVTNGSYVGNDAGAGQGAMYGTTGFDGSTAGVQAVSYLAIVGGYQNGAFSAVLTPSEGYHYLQFLGGISGGANPTYLGGYTGVTYSSSR